MTDQPSSDARLTGRETDRESRAEALMVEGLDRYLAGAYEDAIHIWTRVLFLDRNHQRARAYIERARSAQGERQRRADEALHRAEQLIAEGQIADAGALLSEAAPATTDDARVARLWAEIDRSRRAHTGVTSESEAAVPNAGAPASPARSRAMSTLYLLAAAAVGALLITIASSGAVRGLFGGNETAPLSNPTLQPRSLDVPSGASVGLTRARALYARGRLSEALAILERVVPTGAERAEVDALRVEIQDLLLSTVATSRPKEAQP